MSFNLSKIASCNGDQCRCVTAKPGKMMGQPPKDPNSGKMDSQIFIGKQDPQHATKKKKKTKKKKASDESMVKEAKFGDVMYQGDGILWGAWKNGNYFYGENMPSLQNAQKFLSYCEELFAKPAGELIEEEEASPRLRAMIQNAQGLPANTEDDIMNKAKAYQVVMHSIEQEAAVAGQDYAPPVEVMSAKFNLKQYRKSNKKGV